MLEEDIPLLTEVHVKSDGQSIKTINITADLVAELTAQIKSQLKPQLEEEIEKSVLEKFKKRIHDDLLHESAEVQKASQNFLAEALKEHYELQSQQLDNMSNTIHESVSSGLTQHINEELNTSQQASHASLMEAMHTAIIQAQQVSVEQIKVSVAEEIERALADAQQLVMVNSAAYVDKMKADLATEIPKMMHANADIIKADLAIILSEMQARSLDEVQTKLNRAMPLMEQELTKQFELNLANLGSNALESTTHALQTSANLAKSGLEHALGQMHANGIAEVQIKLAEALPTMELVLTNQLQETLKNLETTTTEHVTHSATLVKTDLDSTLVQMQAQGIAEVQAKLISALPMLQDLLTEKLQITLSALENKTVEDASQELQSKITRLQEDILIEHQNSLTRELSSIYQGLTAKSHTELTIYLDALQLQSKQQLNQEVSEAFPLLYQGLEAELVTSLKQDLGSMADTSKLNFKQALNAELPEVEQALADRVREILSVEVPRIEQQISVNIKAEIEKLLDSVRLIFSK